MLSVAFGVPLEGDVLPFDPPMITQSAKEGARRLVGGLGSHQVSQGKARHDRDDRQSLRLLRADS
jgi:hypothetical protein